MTDEVRETENVAAEEANPEEAQFESRNTLSNKWLLGMIVASFIFALASIPLYRIVCKQIDPGGSAWQNGDADVYEGVEVDTSRTVKVRFATEVQSQLPWSFEAHVKSLEVHPGEKNRALFTVKNHDTTGAIKGKGVYDINPPEAGQYFKKVDCFCFREQTLEAGELAELPLVFWFEPDMPEHIRNITVAYTFFNVDSSLQRSIKRRKAQANAQ